MKRRDIERRLRELRWRMARHGARGDDELVVPRHAEINEYTAKAILIRARRRS